MSTDDIDTLRRFFEVDEDDAVTLLELTQWVDQEIALEQYGYPKDNLMPPPMERRLADANYLARLLEAARDQEPLLADVIGKALYGIDNEELGRRRTVRLQRPSDKGR